MSRYVIISGNDILIDSFKNEIKESVLNKEDKVIQTIKLLLKKDQKEGYKTIQHNIDDIVHSEEGFGHVSDRNGISLLHALVICSWLTYYEKTLLLDKVLKVKDVNINCRDNQDRTPLHYALSKRENTKKSEHQKNTLVRRLLNVADIDVTIKDKKGLTPLLIAAKTMNNISFEKVLLFEGLLDVLFDNLRQGKDIDINAVDEDGKSVLHHLLGKFNKKTNGKLAFTAMLKLLLRYNENTVSEKKEKLSQIEEKLKKLRINPQIKTSNLETKREKTTKFMKQLDLRKNTIDVNLKDKSGKTPLIFAAQWQNEAAVKEIVRHKNVNLNIQDKAGKTALHYCSLETDNTMFNILLKKNSLDVSLQDQYGKTALHNCIEAGTSIRYIRDLLQYGSKVIMLKDDNNESSLSLAKRKKKEEVIKLLEERHEQKSHSQETNEFDRIMRTVEEDNIEMLNQVCENEKDILALKDKEDKHCLHHIANMHLRDHHENIVSRLLERFNQTPGIDINDVDKNARKTALHYAAVFEEGESTCFIDMLIKHNISVNALDHKHKTALHYACQSNGRFHNAMALLKHNNIDVDIVDDLKKTPLHHALENNCHADLILELVKKTGKEEINLQNTEAKVALHYAAERKQNCADLIIDEMLKRADIAPNVRDGTGKTVLHHALRFEKPIREVVTRFLADDRIKMDLGDNEGKTILHYCGIMGHSVQIIEKILARYDGDKMFWKQEDKTKKTALDYACLNKHYHVIEFLKTSMGEKTAPNVTLNVEELTFKDMNKLRGLNDKLFGIYCWKSLCDWLKINDHVKFDEYHIIALGNPEYVYLGNALFENLKASNPTLSTKKFAEVASEHGRNEIGVLLKDFSDVYLKDLPTDVKFRVGILCCNSSDWKIIAEDCDLTMEKITAIQNGYNSSHTSSTDEMFNAIKMFSPRLNLDVLNEGLRKINLVKIAEIISNIIEEKKGRHISK